jgi:hypothetical protein
MKLNNIRQDSVNTILARNEEGKTIALFNADESEIKLNQLDGVKKGRTLEAAELEGLTHYVRADA